MEFSNEQLQAINESFDQDLIITGIAGSGKSMVLAERIIHLVKSHPDHGPIAFFTFINTLADQTRDYLIEHGINIGKEEINITTIDRELEKLINSYGRPFPGKERYFNISYTLYRATRKELKAVHPEYFQKSLRFRTDSWNRFCMDELKWMRVHNVGSLKEYMDLPRYGRGKITPTAPEKEFLYRLYEAYFSQPIVEDAFVDTYCNDLLQDLVKDPTTIPEEAKYDYVFVDEAQDFSVNRMLIAKFLTNIHLTLAYDEAQQIFDTGDVWHEMGLDAYEAAHHSISGNFRNTAEIYELAKDLLTHNTAISANYYSDSIPTIHGEKPKLYTFSDEAAELDGVSKLAMGLAKKHPDATIGILCTRSTLAQKVRLHLFYTYNVRTEHLIPGELFSITKPGIKAAAIAGSKGLEFDYVICAFLEEEKIPGIKRIDAELYEDALNKARNMLYVGMTRARKGLILTYASSDIVSKSRVLNDLSPDHYEACGVAKESIHSRLAKKVLTKDDYGSLVGLSVTHKVFGHGVITSASPSKKTVTITFDSGSSSVYPEGALYKGAFTVENKEE